MSDPRVWLDATQVLIDVLSDDASMTVVPAVPNPRPDEFVVVRRTGGRYLPDAYLDVARMSIECWSGEPNTSQVPVWALATEVRETLRTCVGTGGISRWDEETIGFLPDEISDCPRVIITGSLWLRPS